MTLTLASCAVVAVRVLQVRYTRGMVEFFIWLVLAVILGFVMVKSNEPGFDENGKARSHTGSQLLFGGIGHVLLYGGGMLLVAAVGVSLVKWMTR
jgi:hypothetical protein